MGPQTTARSGSVGGGLVVGSAVLLVAASAIAATGGSSGLGGGTGAPGLGGLVLIGAIVLGSLGAGIIGLAGPAPLRERAVRIGLCALDGVTAAAERSRRRRLGFFGGAALATLALPGSVLGATGPDLSSPMPQCSIGASTIAAGTPLDLSGKVTPPDAFVGVSAYRDKNIREASVASLNDGTWRAVLLFGAADAGVWTVDIHLGDTECASPLSVTLPAGVVAPPTEPPAAADEAGPPVDGQGAATIRDIGVKATVALVVGSWILLLCLALASRARPLTHRSIRLAARTAAFIGILGAFVTVGLFAYFLDSMRHFDTGVPDGDAAILNFGIVGLAVIGSILGTFAALRIKGPTTANAG